MQNNLLYIFNNKYERKARHKDTYFTDKPGLTNDEINEINEKNYNILLSDTLKQIQEIEKYFDNFEKVQEYQDIVSREVDLYYSYDNIDNFIQDYFIKRFEKNEI